MPNNKISPDLFSSASDVRRRTTAPRPSLAARVTARLRARHLDRQLAVGVPAAAGSALAVHQARLTSVAEREAVARTLRRVVTEVHAGGGPLSSRVGLHATNIEAAEDLIDAITLRLHSPRPVSARGHGAAALSCWPTDADPCTDSAGATSAAGSARHSRAL